MATSAQLHDVFRAMIENQANRLPNRQEKGGLIGLTTQAPAALLLERVRGLIPGIPPDGPLGPAPRPSWLKLEPQHLQSVTAWVTFAALQPSTTHEHTGQKSGTALPGGPFQKWCDEPACRANATIVYCLTFLYEDPDDYMEKSITIEVNCICRPNTTQVQFTTWWNIPFNGGGDTGWQTVETKDPVNLVMGLFNSRNL